MEQWYWIFIPVIIQIGSDVQWMTNNLNITSDWGFCYCPLTTTDKGGNRMMTCWSHKHHRKMQRQNKVTGNPKKESRVDLVHYCVCAEALNTVIFNVVLWGFHQELDSREQFKQQSFHGWKVIEPRCRRQSPTFWELVQGQEVLPPVSHLGTSGYLPQVSCISHTQICSICVLS